MNLIERTGLAVDYGACEEATERIVITFSSHKNRHLIGPGFGELFTHFKARFAGHPLGMALNEAGALQTLSLDFLYGRQRNKWAELYKKGGYKSPIYLANLSRVLRAHKKTCWSDDIFFGTTRRLEPKGS